MLRSVALCVLPLLFDSTVHSSTQQTSATFSIPPDSARWHLHGTAKVTEYQGRNAVLIDGGLAILKDFKMRDGVLDVDVSTPADYGFFGFYFRTAEDGANRELVYLR
jgi:hypothetical protein